MNICLLSRSFHKKRGGIETYTYRMANVFAKKGHKVHIVTTSGEGKFNLENTHKSIVIHKINLKKIKFPGYWRINSFLPLADIIYHKTVSREINRLIRLYKIDIVEVPDFEGYRPSINRSFPIVVRLHGYNGLQEYFNNPKKDFKRSILRRWTNSWLKNVDAITSVSNNFSKEISDIFKINIDRITTVYSGIDQEIFSPKEKNDANISILYIGKLLKNKGIEVLSKAIPLVAKKYPGVKFIIIGKDTLRENDQKSYKDFLRIGLNAFNVELIDELSIKEVINFYQKSLIAVFPSLREPGATVCLESLSCGCATIVTNVGGFPEFITHRVNGLIVPPGNHALLADAIIELIENKTLRQTIAANGLEKAKKVFSLDSAGEQTLKIYEQAIAKFNKMNIKKNDYRN